MYKTIRRVEREVSEKLRVVVCIDETQAALRVYRSIVLNCPNVL